MTEIDSNANTIDSRDVITRIKELQLEISEEDKVEFEGQEELDKLVDLQERCEGYCADWKYGAILVSDSYFTEYAQTLAEDIGAVGSKVEWPYTCIDWEAAARDLRMDYTPVDFDGTTFWYR
jgi:antirestriction protein